MLQSSFDLCSKPGFYKIMHEAYVPFGTCMKVYCFMPLSHYFKNVPSRSRPLNSPAPLQTSFGINDPGDKCVSSDPTSVTTNISADPSPLSLASMLLSVQYGWSLATVLWGINCGLTYILSQCININKMAASLLITHYYCLSIKTY